MSDANSGVGDALRGLIAMVFGPIRSAFARVFRPVDRVLQPVADKLFNETIGGHFGRISGLQFFILVFGFLAILFFPYWAHFGMPLLQVPPFVPLIGGFVFIDQGLFPITYVQTASLACVWAIFAMSWDIQSGYTGYISFGHSVLSGSAGYAVGLILVHVSADMNFYLVALIAILASLVVGLLIALPSLRLRGPYFSLVTFVAVLLMLRLNQLFGEWTNGELGLRISRAIQWRPGAREAFAEYYLMVFPMLLVALVLIYIARSNTGLILTGIRENEDAVSAAGINPTKFKLWSFVMSSIPMGLGGVLLAINAGGVDPITFIDAANSIEMIAMAVIGGMASVIGPLFGAFLFIFLSEQLMEPILGFVAGLPVVGSVPFLDEGARWIWLWVVVLFILVFARDGVFRKLWHSIGNLRGESE